MHKKFVSQTDVKSTIHQKHISISTEKFLLTKKSSIVACNLQLFWNRCMTTKRDYSKLNNYSRIKSNITSLVIVVVDDVRISKKLLTNITQTPAKMQCHNKWFLQLTYSILPKMNDVIDENMKALLFNNFNLKC